MSLCVREHAYDQRENLRLFTTEFAVDVARSCLSEASFKYISMDVSRKFDTRYHWRLSLKYATTLRVSPLIIRT